MRHRLAPATFLVALALAGCGGGDDGASGTTDVAATGPTATPSQLAVRDSGVITRAGPVSIHDLSYAMPGGSRIQSYVLVPRRGKRHPAVVFLHGSGGSRLDFLVIAARLAKKGIVTMTVSIPPANDYGPMVVAVRRALDVLSARPEVDPSRLGVAGHSLGGQLAAVVAGRDPRPRAVAMVSASGTVGAVENIRNAHADLLFLAGRQDELVPQPELQSLINAAPAGRTVHWYPARHGMSDKAWADLDDWLARELGARSS